MKYTSARHVPRGIKQQLEEELARLERMQAEDLAEKLLLWEWGQWARRTGTHLGYPRSLLPFSAKGTWEKDLRKYIGDISDEQAMLIDRAVSELKAPYRLIIIAIFVLQIESRRLPRVLRLSERRISALKNQALGVLSEKLEGKIRARVDLLTR